MADARPLGLPDDAFAQKRPHRGLITKSEARAVSLYKLGLARGSVVWDVGAGSGSVALEAALIASDGMVYAVERDAESIAMLRRNLRRLGPANVAVTPGDAPAALVDLPKPDCVFVGGGGGKLTAILECAAARLNAEGRIVVNLAAMERALQAHACLTAMGFEVELMQISAARAKPLPDGALRLAAQNPVLIVAAARMRQPKADDRLGASANGS